MTTSASAGRPTRAAMTPWRLESLRLVRTARGLALFAVYLIVGLLGPVLARYMSTLLSQVQGQITITARPPVPQDGIAQYLDQIAQTGLIVVVVVSAGSLAFDSRRGISLFLRTRTAGMWALLLPRYLVPAAAAAAASVLGTLAAWYETVLLIGPLPAGPMLAGMLCQALYLAFAVAVVAAAASFARSALGTVGIALAVLLLALPLAGVVGALRDWMPSALMRAPVELLGSSEPADFLPALAVTAIAVPLLLAVAARRLRHREP